jgi:hypothetical protein
MVGGIGQDAGRTVSGIVRTKDVVEGHVGGTAGRTAVGMAGWRDGGHSEQDAGRTVSGHEGCG